MAGLNLGTSIKANATYTPMTPASAGTPSGTSTIGQKAYGIAGTGTSVTGPATAGVGSVGVGLAALAGLIFIWWSLPR